MSAVIVPQKIVSVSMNVCADGFGECELKLKVNQTTFRHSTAKLTDQQKKEHQIGCDAIVWNGFQTILPSKVVKTIQKADSNLRVKVSSILGSIIVTINLNSTTLQKFEPDQKCFLDIDSLATYLELCQKNPHPRHALEVEMVLSAFKQFNSLSDACRCGLIRLVEYLDVKEIRLVAQETFRSSSIKLIVVAINWLQDTEKACCLFRNCLIEATINFFSKPPNSLQLDLMVPIFDLFSVRNLEHFILKLTDYQDVNAKTAKMLLEVYRRLQKVVNRLVITPCINETYTRVDQSEFLHKAIDLINRRTNYLARLKTEDENIVTFHLVGLNILIDCIVFSVTKKQELDFKCAIKNLEKLINNFSNFYTVEFFAYLVIQKFRLYNPKYLVLFDCFWHVHSETFPNEPWKSLKRDEGFFFKLADKTKSYMHISLWLIWLQNAYSNNKQESMEDFECFVNDLLDNSKTKANKKILAFVYDKKVDVSQYYFLIIGLFETLCRIQQEHKDDQKICRSINELLKRILELNESASTNSIFRAKSTSARSYIIQKIKNFLTPVELETAEDETGARRAFEEVDEVNHLFNFKQKFPWIEAIRTQRQKLSDDKQLNQDELYRVQLHGIDPTKEKQSMEALVNEELNNSRKVIVIVGEAGTGKSLFLKYLFRKLLENYQLNGYLPFYIALGSLTRPDTALIEEVLRQYGLQEHIELLKTLPTLWLLDGYDEIFLGNDQKHFNIYQNNQLNLWPKARFVFTCRKKSLSAGEENTCFAPLGEKTKLLNVAPFEESDIEEFLLKYTEKTPGLSIDWTVKRFRDSIEELKLTSVISTPFYLRQIVDCLSSLDPALIQKEKNKIDIKCSLFDRIVFLLINREIEKMVQKEDRILVTTKVYCEQLLHISERMQICGITRVADKNGRDFNEKERFRMAEKQLLERKLAGDLVDPKCYISKLSMDQCQKKLDEIGYVEAAENELQSCLFGSSYPYLTSGALIKLEKGEMEFSHIVLYQYFVDLNKDKEARQRLIDMCSEHDKRSASVSPSAQ